MALAMCSRVAQIRARSDHGSEIKELHAKIGELDRGQRFYWPEGSSDAAGGDRKAMMRRDQSRSELEPAIDKVLSISRSSFYLRAHRG